MLSVHLPDPTSRLRRSPLPAINCFVHISSPAPLLLMKCKTCVMQSTDCFHSARHSICVATDCNHERNLERLYSTLTRQRTGKNNNFATKIFHSAVQFSTVSDAMTVHALVLQRLQLSESEPIFFEISYSKHQTFYNYKFFEFGKYSTMMYMYRVEDISINNKNSNLLDEECHSYIKHPSDIINSCNGFTFQLHFILNN